MYCIKVFLKKKNRYCVWAKFVYLFSDLPMSYSVNFTKEVGNIVPTKELLNDNLEYLFYLAILSKEN